ncbi:AAA family ATPase [Demequina iriomotensis]|uniref:AAA family ATPase n=1 Tax=Demequina iriomotensis TaxID=1536641 RepID=UPI000781B67F|nr:tyrosine-protein kinase family protein [Demequina iriomotensis]
MSAPIAVIVAVRGAEEARVVAELDGQPGIVVVRRCADLPEAIAVARAGLGSVAVLSEQPHLDADAVRAMRAAGVGVVGVSSGPAERLEALGVRVATSDLADAVRAALSQPAPVFEAPPERGSGAVITVWGTGGAPGRTTVAVNLAAEAALGGRRTVLVDLDTYGASIASALGLVDEVPGVAAVVRAAARGEDVPALLDRHLLDVAPGLRVLTGLTRAARWPEVTAGGLERMWPALRAIADVVVVDVAAPAEAGEAAGALAGGPRRDAATLAALAQADAVVAVGGAEPHQLVRLVHALLDHPGAMPVVAVNRIRASVAGPRPEDAIAAALGRHAGVTEVWPLPWDPRACDAAARDGRMLAEAAPRSPLRASIASMTAAVLAAARASRDAPAAVPD